MKSINGLWNNYRQGEVYRALDAIINGLKRKGYKIQASSIDSEKRITTGEEFFRMIKEYEQRQGLENLLELFSRGLELGCIKGEGVEIAIAIYLRTPEESEDRKNLFKEVIVNWFANQEITFSEKFFKQPRERFLPHQLERALKRSFGFQFRYKILVGV